LIRITAFFIHDETNIISGLLISFVGLCAAYLLFKKLLLLDYSQSEVSKILIFLLFFPTSFYFAAIYTESLFMLLVFAAFYFARKRRWYLAAICAGLASATRITGIFLLPALLWEWLYVSIQTHKSSKINLLFIAKTICRSPILYIAPLGLISYMLYLQWQFKDALYFWHAQPAFGAARSLGLIFPPQVVWRYLKILSSINPAQNEFWVALFEIVCYFFAVIALYIAYRKKVRISYQLFSWGVVLVPPLTGTFTSIPRYILTAFPLMIILGTIKNKVVQTAVILLSAFLFMLLASYFIRGLWVS
jgi:Gpi18-like mannosyltransferase